MNFFNVIVPFLFRVVLIVGIAVIFFYIILHEIKTELELDEIELEFNTELKYDCKKLKKN